MGSQKDLSSINAEIGILEFQRELIESEKWNDKTHLDKKYQMHLNTFDNVVRYLCNSVGIFRSKEINENGLFGVNDQNGEKVNFDISIDFNKTRGEDKLVSYLIFNEKTKAHSLLHYSPTKGIGFEYGANLLPINVQLGKKDFFGKTIEKMITDINSSTDGIEFDINVDRFSKAPNGLKYFYISTKDFVEKDKQGDAISIISTLDGLIRGLHKNPRWVSGTNFVHEKEDPLFKIGIKLVI